MRLFNILSTTEAPDPKLYPGTLYIVDGTAVPCIVSLEKYDPAYAVDWRYYKNTYSLLEIHLPYGITEYPEEETYNTTSKRNTISVGYGSDFCDIEIDMEHEATSGDWEEVTSAIVYTSGEYCVSKVQGKLHFSTCRYAQNIKEENLIYFPSTQIAEIFGFTPDNMCSVCAEKY